MNDIVLDSLNNCPVKVSKSSHLRQNYDYPVKDDYLTTEIRHKRPVSGIETPRSVPKQSGIKPVFQLSQQEKHKLIGTLNQKKQSIVEPLNYKMMDTKTKFNI